MSLMRIQTGRAKPHFIKPTFFFEFYSQIKMTKVDWIKGSPEESDDSGFHRVPLRRKIGVRYILAMANSNHC